ncbi:hypothetical protein BX666DRAFT_1887074 [Dichotomocladium elegans]|nr:hypothetical protein BX666DRAFT_1887074 [Dichotomocladium elegans]
MTPAIPKDCTKKRPVIVSLPPKKSFESELSIKHVQQNSESSTCPCICTVAANRVASSISERNGDGVGNNGTDLTSMLLFSKTIQKQLEEKQPEPQQMPTASAITLEAATCNSETKLGQSSTAASRSECSCSEEEKNRFASSHANLYDDPAVMHVIEHSKECHDGHNRKLSTAHSSSPPPLVQPGGVSVHTLQHGFHPVCAPGYYPDLIWDTLSKKVEQLIDARIRSAFRPIDALDESSRLDSLEIAVTQLEHRIFELETPGKCQQQKEQQQQRQRRQSMPIRATTADKDDDTLSSSNMLDTEKAALQATIDSLKSMLQHQQQEHANHTKNQGGRENNFSNSRSGEKDNDARMQQLQRECQGLQARLAEEQQKSKQLELQHVDFHKRQIEDHIKMEKMRQQIQTLESELKKHRQQRPGRINHNNQQNNLNRREQKEMHTHPQHFHHNSTASYHGKLPTPESSPLSSHPEHHSSNQQEEAVREEDGYLIFNTNINGELIHCKVKIPTMATTRRVTDMALMSPPMTRACSPRDILSAGNKKKSGLNPNAPEWRNGTWK